MLDLVRPSEVAKLPDRYQRRAHQIVDRVREIDALCAPCQPKDILPVVQRMIGQLRPQPDTEEVAIAAEFKAACRDLPKWAIREAANDFLAGLVENHTGQFMPTCAEFAKRARDIMKPFLVERHSLRTEASKLVERARDEQERLQIEIERSDAAVKERVSGLLEAVKVGQPAKPIPLRGGISAERQAALDAMKKPRKFTSKIGYRGPDDGDPQPADTGA